MSVLDEHGQLYRVVDGICITKVKNVEPERGLRLYCEQADDIWALQVRGPLRLQNGTDGKDFIIANAHLDREEMMALRDAINELLNR